MASLSSRHVQLKTYYHRELKSIKRWHGKVAPEPGIPDSPNRLWHCSGEEVTPVNFTWERDVLIVLFPNIKNARALRENKSKQGVEESTSQTSWHLLPLIYCSLLSMWFPPICFRCVFAFTPWKQTAFSLNYSLQLSPHHPDTHIRTHTQRHMQ